VVRVVCAWCGRQLDERGTGGTPLASHGMCAYCAEESGVFPVERLLGMSRTDYDRLPIGIVELDGEGTVRAYNRAEEQLSGFGHGRFVGRNFFRDVAPCTAVREFEGRYREMVSEAAVSDEEFSFVFRFAGGPRLMLIHMVYDAARSRGILAVKALA
jgi:photoactive yellow protein